MDDTSIQARAEGHKVRRAILGVLIFAEGCTLEEIADAMPEVANGVVPETSPEAVIEYHLGVLEKAKLVYCDRGIYRAT